MFPGKLHVTSLNYSADMSDRSSAVFQSTAASISELLSQALRGQRGYVRSEVVQLTPGSVVATVDNIYEDSDVTQTDVDQAIEQAIASAPSGLLQGSTYTGADLCSVGPVFPCDVSTTSCSSVNGQPTCSCLPGYVTIGQLYSNSSCRACPSGQRADGDSCQPCSFGYAGFNCNDSSLLAVVVVSCVLGGLLLILVLALMVFWCWRGCSKSEPDFDSPYSVSNMGQAWPTDITPIPRASTNWDAGPSLEMTAGGSTSALVDRKNQTNGRLNPKGWRKTGSYDLQPDDLKTFKGKNTSRYSYLVQGHENPYFLPGDENKK